MRLPPIFLSRSQIISNAVHVMLMKKLSDSPADVMENLSFGLSVDHVLAVTVSGLLGAVWKFVGPEWVFVLGAAVSEVHLGVAVWLEKKNGHKMRIYLHMNRRWAIFYWQRMESG